MEKITVYRVTLSGNNGIGDEFISRNKKALSVFPGMFDASNYPDSTYEGLVENGFAQKIVIKCPIDYKTDRTGFKNFLLKAITSTERKDLKIAGFCLYL